MKGNNMYNNAIQYPLSKEYITNLKRNDNVSLALLVEKNITNSANLIFILEHLRLFACHI